MKNFYSKLDKKFLFIILFYFIGLYLRLYQVNFEDYWFDEQASFYVADPLLSFKETVQRSYELDYGTHILFNFILKYFFHIFYYNPDIGRLVPLFFGFLSIPAISYLTFYITKNKSYIFVTFLTSINFYLISYSQELREYSLVFLLSILSILFFYKVIDSLNYSKNKLINFVSFTVFSLIGLCTHVFFFIIIFSQITYLFFIYYSERKKIFLILVNIIFIFTIYLFLMYDILILQISINDFWIKNVEIDFIIDLYFPRFFGSHIMGALYLLILIYLLILNKKNLFQYENKNLLLVILFFSSYLIPVIYGVIAIPVLTDRYIIYTLVPILILISNLVFNLKNKTIKLSILFIIITFTLINNYSEIFKRKISKPEFNLALETILESNTKNVFINAQRPMDKIIVNNYLESININKKYNIVFYDTEQNLNINNQFWLLCYEPINSFNCNLTNNRNNLWKKSKKHKFHLLEATLYKK
jgi:hypothetical protein